MSAGVRLTTLRAPRSGFTWRSILLRSIARADAFTGWPRLPDIISVLRDSSHSWATVIVLRIAARVSAGSAPSAIAPNSFLAFTRACSGVTFAVVPMVSRRLRPWALRYWMTHDLAPDGLTRRPNPPNWSSNTTWSLSPGCSLSTSRLVSFGIGPCEYRNALGKQWDA